MEFFEQYKDDMISNVKSRLEEYDATENPILKIRHSRFEHTMRVYQWMKRLFAAYFDIELSVRKAISDPLI